MWRCDVVCREMRVYERNTWYERTGLLRIHKAVIVVVVAVVVCAVYSVLFLTKTKSSTQKTSSTPELLNSTRYLTVPCPQVGQKSWRRKVA